MPPARYSIMMNRSPFAEHAPSNLPHHHPSPPQAAPRLLLLEDGEAQESDVAAHTCGRSPRQKDADDCDCFSSFNVMKNSFFKSQLFVIRCSHFQSIIISRDLLPGTL